jgi:hypothetical protein
MEPALAFQRLKIPGCITKNYMSIPGRLGEPAVMKHTVLPDMLFLILTMLGILTMVVLAILALSDGL